MEDFFLLSKLPLNTCAKLVKLQSIDYKTKLRLFELGFVSGQKITLLQKSIFGKTYLVQIGNCVLSIRGEIANKMVVKV